MKKIPIAETAFATYAALSFENNILCTSFL